ncbi:hypothetical protein LG296_19590 (plasmid) [Ureibacillus chungkukjangi]|uniref:hypothetical protein n=1 Tax=Ureibacillus chungkukjangi TaxID=1202712 RepID=UPI000D385DAD|nr:hypothetical protein [Ureibacillus chungkukjangi]MCM3390217.1 hypothetical protein [Ureibacillus chungkukjangi]HCG4536034.1 hypothetical protein [Salmonella enterica subsp. enterica serovar Typhi str. AG3]
MKKKASMLISSSVLSVVLLTGCGESNKDIASGIVDELEEKRYSLVEKTYEDATDELTAEEKNELDKVISKEIISFLETSYKQIESESNKVPFYNLTNEIKNLGIENEDLSSTLNLYAEEDEEATKVVQKVPSQKDNSQEQLELAFENDLALFNTLYNELVVTATPVIKGFTNEPIDVDEASVYALIDKLDEFVMYMRNRQDYSGLVKYEQTNKYFMEGAAKLIKAYSYMSDNMTSANYDLVMEGLQAFVEAEDMFVKASEMYSQELQ